MAKMYRAGGIDIHVGCAQDTPCPRSTSQGLCFFGT
eukprot:CAMPEP_0174291962 /NCGR_PEP_ID=MMETSP0809-20121228/33819_1 /TAXON_ID=73025 ORGANISM="Eutreptiella gymnastica-like, Strain CCMP1594" /NCGR_SAMPLE_ID=MMETSP0809 /ASSEMBLY_ACC=CAM_ASM_000658 /LENGTH=35 /DNA_ID= /DNA_START= /DNA_END= /DNA_ORIENTATION=